MNKKDFVVCCLLLVAILLISFLIIEEHRRSTAFLKDISTIKSDHNVLYSLQGRYFAEGFYCVRTDSFFGNVNKTDVHEQCHALVHKDKDHFCR